MVSVSAAKKIEVFCGSRPESVREVDVAARIVLTHLLSSLCLLYQCLARLVTGDYIFLEGLPGEHPVIMRSAGAKVTHGMAVQGKQ
ncbi:hypothetical protein KC361_g128 [Hortaea werneckii]|nr:hypothetical protein KC361_g128 [Hortaea werneckii]